QQRPGGGIPAARRQPFRPCRSELGRHSGVTPFDRLGVQRAAGRDVFGAESARRAARHGPTGEPGRTDPRLRSPDGHPRTAAESDPRPSPAIGEMRPVRTLTAVALGLVLLTVGASGQRQRLSMDSDWRFTLGDPAGFAYDITRHLVAGVNVVAVRVDNSLQPNSRWYSGSGIYRHVWLTLVDPLHVGHWGTYVTTPRADPAAATVVIHTRVENDRPTGHGGVLRTLIVDAEGREVALTDATFSLAPRANVEIEHRLQVKAPRLWSLA